VQQAYSFSSVDKQPLTDNEGNKVELSDVNRRCLFRCDENVATGLDGIKVLRVGWEGEWTFFSCAQHLPNVESRERHTHTRCEMK